jgi:outer membrane receptor for ferrienterochelin and colicins
MRLFEFLITTILWVLLSITVQAQTGKVLGRITAPSGEIIQGASVQISKLNKFSIADSNGLYQLNFLPAGNWNVMVTAQSFSDFHFSINISNDSIQKDIVLLPNHSLQEVVVSGTLKPMVRAESPVPVEVYSAAFFKTNPAPTIFDALQTINGVRPQINCNVCNTGDIRINGLDGPYTMVLIDGMPIVSGLSTVYGLNGIPQSLLERVEIVKGPASTLYGSEAVGGLINIITKKPVNAPLLSVDLFSTTWKETNADIGLKLKVSDKIQSLAGINYFNYQNPVDNNKDNFTDLTLQHRISVFNKWNFERKHNRLFALAARYVYEDRWGGEMNWTKYDRGGTDVYGESIYTKRWELFGTYQLPFKEHLLWMFSVNRHQQNSVYGDMPFIADQQILFSQLTWNKTAGKHDLLTGLALRYTYYDDNTVATAQITNTRQNHPSKTLLPGIFIQDEISLNQQNKLLVGVRYDYNSLHGNIFTPRINYKWNSKDKKNILRVSVGNGYRVANVFTEDHAALTGARQVVFINDLHPETSWNTNVNFVRKLYTGSAVINLDATLFYTYFKNKIIADYDTDPNKIIYDNLDGFAVSKGASLNADITFNNLRIMLGATAMDVYSKENNLRIRQLFTEKFSGVWTISYSFRSIGLTADYTGNIYGPMRLPLLSDTDPRREYSPWWSVQNIHLTKKIKDKLEVYAGIKNILNWTINKGVPFIIARSHDPFDRQVQFDASGNAMVTADNPYGLTFDPTYAYGPNQGIRGFFGIRYTYH